MLAALVMQLLQQGSGLLLALLVAQLPRLLRFMHSSGRCTLRVPCRLLRVQGPLVLAAPQLWICTRCCSCCGRNLCVRCVVGAVLVA